MVRERVVVRPVHNAAVDMATIRALATGVSARVAAPTPAEAMRTLVRAGADPNPLERDRYDTVTVARRT
jgi:hypothetical protein